jgi:3-oxoacyl-[acyl-carrier protein] reductase
VIHPELSQTIGDLLQHLPVEVAASGPQSVSPARSGRELTGLRALVTGSSSGIGQAIAVELAAAGADVMVHRRGPLGRAEEVATAIRAYGVRSLALQADLRDPAARNRLVEDAWGAWSGLDIWVNNAGADTLTGEANRWPFEHKLEELLAVDVTGTILLCRAVGARMKAQGSGVLVNMGWDRAETGMEGDSGQLFAASKAAVMAFTKSLALTLAPEVRVNCLAPGWIRTAWGEQASRAWQERVRQETPLRRWGTPQDVAAAARWLAGPASAYLTGQVIRINGGAVR